MSKLITVCSQKDWKPACCQKKHHRSCCTLVERQFVPGFGTWKMTIQGNPKYIMTKIFSLPLISHRMRVSVPAAYVQFSRGKDHVIEMRLSKQPHFLILISIQQLMQLSFLMLQILLNDKNKTLNQKDMNMTSKSSSQKLQAVCIIPENLNYMVTYSFPWETPASLRAQAGCCSINRELFNIVLPSLFNCMLAYGAPFYIRNTPKALQQLRNY